VFPTPVGMNRGPVFSIVNVERVPHARGDEPVSRERSNASLLCSPRPWG